MRGEVDTKIKQQSGRKKEACSSFPSFLLFPILTWYDANNSIIYLFFPKKKCCNLLLPFFFTFLVFRVPYVPLLECTPTHLIHVVRKNPLWTTKVTFVWTPAYHQTYSPFFHHPSIRSVAHIREHLNYLSLLLSKSFSPFFPGLQQKKVPNSFSCFPPKNISSHFPPRKKYQPH